MSKKASKGTVLYREPLPKYSFMVSKKNENTKNDIGKTELNKLSGHKGQSENRNAIKTERKDISLEITAKSNDVTESSPLRNVMSAPNVQVVSPVRTVAETNSQTTKTDVRPVSKVDPLPTDNQTSELSSPNDESYLGQVEKLKEELGRIKEENIFYKTQLDIQLNVNSELKKLLIASVGEDLHHKVESLVRTKALLSLEIGDYTEKASKDYENIDHISIQADMWRSKFVASKFLIDEVARAKAFYALQYQESQTCLQRMLNERHELRNHMIEAHRFLRQVRLAFDPLNTQMMPPLPSTNVLALAKANLDLSETIKYRLLPGSSYSPNDIINFMGDDMTSAESMAQQLLAKQVNPQDERYSIPSASPCANMIERFHPAVRYDTLPINRCCKCSGELKVV